MKYFLDFDRTIFNTPEFKKSVGRRPSFFQMVGQLKGAITEWFNPEGTGSKFERFRRMLGTFLAHGRFAFTAEELKAFIYPDVPPFLAANECVIVTYGVESFIRAKVTSALTDLPVSEVVYTRRRKGRTIQRLTKDTEGPFCFIDDAHFQLESVAHWCPEVSIVEIRRDSQPGDGRWPVIHSLEDLAMSLVLRQP